MSADLAQRLLALAAVALLAAVVAVAVVSQDSSAGGPAPPRAAEAPGGGWYTALAGARRPGSSSRPTTCGVRLTERSLGITHPVLPCRTKVVLLYGETQVLTEVIDNRMSEGGRQIELTRPLATRLGIDANQVVRWRFAVR